MLPEHPLSVRSIEKSFGKHKVLDSVSFDVHRGEILGLMGASGSGKSLVLKLIIGLEKIDSGEIFFDGQEITHLHERELYSVRTKIGYVFQSGALFDSMTIEENLRYPLERHTTLSEDEIRAVITNRLQMVDMEGCESLYPSQMSGGMTKRAGLVRATMLTPQFVLLDEPTAGLDPVSIRRFILNLRTYRNRSPLSGIFVSHDIRSLSAIVDRIAILWQGTIHEIGSVEDILQCDDPVVKQFTSTDYGGELYES